MLNALLAVRAGLFASSKTFHRGVVRSKNPRRDSAHCCACEKTTPCREFGITSISAPGMPSQISSVTASGKKGLLSAAIRCVGVAMEARWGLRSTSRSISPCPSTDCGALVALQAAFAVAARLEHHDGVNLHPVVRLELRRLWNLGGRL